MWLGKNKKIKTLNTEFWLKNRFGQKKKQKKNIKIFWLKHKFWIQKTHKINLFQNIFAQKKKKEKGFTKSLGSEYSKKEKKNSSEPVCSI